MKIRFAIGETKDGMLRQSAGAQHLFEHMNDSFLGRGCGWYLTEEAASDTR